MSAVELIKQVRALPERERKRFVLALLSMEEFDPGDKKTTRRPTKWPDVEARARQVFGDRIVTNLVLLERDESRF